MICASHKSLRRGRPWSPATRARGVKLPARVMPRHSSSVAYDRWDAALCAARCAAAAAAPPRRRYVGNLPPAARGPFRGGGRCRRRVAAAAPPPQPPPPTDEKSTVKGHTSMTPPCQRPSGTPCASQRSSYHLAGNWWDRGAAARSDTVVPSEASTSEGGPLFEGVQVRWPPLQPMGIRLSAAPPRQHTGEFRLSRRSHRVTNSSRTAPRLY